MTGRHVEVRLIGEPDAVAAALHAIGTVVDLTAGTRKPTRDRDGRVIQYGTLTAPTTAPAALDGGVPDVAGPAAASCSSSSSDPPQGGTP